jgi:hypothetical protein
VNSSLTLRPSAGDWAKRREVHRCGDEAVWWNKAGIDPTVTARALWLEMHPLPAAPSEPTQPKENGASEPIQLTKTDT